MLVCLLVYLLVVPCRQMVFLWDIPMHRIKYPYFFLLTTVIAGVSWAKTLSVSIQKSQNALICSFIPTFSVNISTQIFLRMVNWQFKVIPRILGMTLLGMTNIIWCLAGLNALVLFLRDISSFLFFKKLSFPVILSTKRKQLCGKIYSQPLEQDHWRIKRIQTLAVLVLNIQFKIHPWRASNFFRPKKFQKAMINRVPVSLFGNTHVYFHLYNSSVCQ